MFNIEQVSYGMQINTSIKSAYKFMYFFLLQKALLTYTKWLIFFFVRLFACHKLWLSTLFASLPYWFVFFSAHFNTNYTHNFLSASEITAEEVRTDMNDDDHQYRENGFLAKSRFAGIVIICLLWVRWLYDTNRIYRIQLNEAFFILRWHFIASSAREIILWMKKFEMHWLCGYESRAVPLKWEAKTVPSRGKNTPIKWMAGNYLSICNWSCLWAADVLYVKVVFRWSCLLALIYNISHFCGVYCTTSQTIDSTCLPCELRNVIEITVFLLVHCHFWPHTISVVGIPISWPCGRRCGR